MKVLQGYRYSVTANEEVTVTDENGLNLTCPAGQQTYFTATCDEVEVSGDAVVTQARGHITIGSGGGGGGEKIAPGEVVVGGTQGSAFIVQLNECKRCPIFIDDELPEGVTFEKLENGIIANVKDTASTSQLNYVFPLNKPYGYGRIFASTTITQLPDSINFASLIDGSYMFYYCSSLSEFNSNLPALTNGTYMFFYCSSLSEFNSNLPALTSCNNMFEGCTILASFNTDLPVLEYGSYMFKGCSSLSEFNSDLPALKSATGMFESCRILASFDIDLPSLTKGDSMFRGCYGLSEFNIDLPALTNSDAMFYGCKGLVSFSGNLSALSNGSNMFSSCNKFKSFSSDLPVLTNGSYMFTGCKLDLASVTRIVTTVPSYTSGSHQIVIGVDRNEVTQEQQDNANTILTSKGWTVTWQRN